MQGTKASLRDSLFLGLGCVGDIFSTRKSLLSDRSYFPIFFRDGCSSKWKPKTPSKLTVGIQKSLVIFECREVLRCDEALRLLRRLSVSLCKAFSSSYLLLPSPFLLPNLQGSKDNPLGYAITHVPQSTGVLHGSGPKTGKNSRVKRGKPFPKNWAEKKETLPDQNCCLPSSDGSSPAGAPSSTPNTNIGPFPGGALEDGAMT